MIVNIDLKGSVSSFPFCFGSQEAHTSSSHLGTCVADVSAEESYIRLCSTYYLVFSLFLISLSYVFVTPETY